MARITEEMKVQINELYHRLGVKAQVARELGISAASVTRYLIPNYIPIAFRNVIECNAVPSIPEEFIAKIETAIDRANAFTCLTCMTKEEEEELKELRKEIYV